MTKILHNMSRNNMLYKQSSGEFNLEDSSNRMMEQIGGGNEVPERENRKINSRNNLSKFIKRQSSRVIVKQEVEDDEDNIVYDENVKNKKDYKLFTLRQNSVINFNIMVNMQDSA